MSSSVPQSRSASSQPVSSVSAQPRAGRPGALRLTPLAAALAALLVAGGMAAPAQATTPVGGAWFAAQGRDTSPHAARLAAARAQQGNGAASRRQALTQKNLQRSMDNINRTAAAIAAQQAAQKAARKKALAASSGIPDGLGKGGLEADMAAGWLNAKAPTQRRQGGRTEVTIKQTEQKAILNWKTFNVGRDTTVRFDQRGGDDAKAGNTWSVLNRIDDPSGRPSRIAGRIKAEGAVYLINRNGVIFHGSSQVNARNLLASTLKLTDEQFMRGIANPARFDITGGNHIGIPVLGEYPDSINTFVGDPFEPGPAPGNVSVEAGAELTAHGGGKVMLFAPKVGNAGQVSAPDGQVILAAGENVYLKAFQPGDVDGVRGLDVAVSAPATRTIGYTDLIGVLYNRQVQPMLTDAMGAMRARADAVGYEASNTGIITAERGDITMQSRSVLQAGVLQATTALNNRNGSIRLRAWSQGLHAYSDGSDINHMRNWDAGTLTLAPGSVAQILPDAGDTGEIEQAALATRYEPGRIELRGKAVNVQGRANVWAPAGRIDVQSSLIPIGIEEERSAYVLAEHDGNRIYVDAGAFLGVGGLHDVLVPTARNFIDAEFRINELRDSPLNRDSWLRGQKVVVDRRVGGTFGEGPMAGVQWVTDGDGNTVPGAWVGSRLGDMTGWVGVGKTDLRELSTQGGSISLATRNGDVIVRPGVMLDVSGGSVRYSGGYNTTTLLRASNGRIYNIGEAPENLVYVGFAGQYARESVRWGVIDTWQNPLIGSRRYEPGYTEGRDAGSVEIKAGRNLILEGDVWGGVVTGDRQAAQDAPRGGGTLTIGGSAVNDTTWSMGRLIIGAAPRLLPRDFAFDSPEDAAWYDHLAPEETGTGEDGRLKHTWLSDAMLTGSGLGELNLYVTDDSVVQAAAMVELAPGARLSLQRVEGSEPAITVAGTIRAPGGSIALESGADLVLASTGRLDVSGEWMNSYRDGAPRQAPAIDGGTVSINQSLPYGALRVQAGSIIDVSGGGRLGSAGDEAVLQAGDAGTVRLGGIRGETGLAGLDLRAHAAGSGGALELLVEADVQIGGEAPAEAGGEDLVHLPADLYGRQGFRSFTVDAGSHSISVPQGVSARQTLHSIDLVPADYVDAPSGAHLRELGSIGPAPAYEQLARAPGAVRLIGQQIDVAADATLGVDLRGSLSLGEIAEIGQIDVRGLLDAPAGAIELTARAIALHPGSQVLARGAAVIDEVERERREGVVLPGGRVSIQGAALNLARGSLIDVSGASGWVDFAAGGSLGRANGLSPVRLASDGGSISIAGLGTIEGRLLARSGGPGAAGGSLSFGYAGGAAGSGEPPPAAQILDLLKMLDPDCNGAGDFANCTSDDPYKVVGWDIDQFLFFSGTPVVISREFVDLVVSSAQGDRTSFVVSEHRPGPAGAPKPHNPADFGLSDTALDMFRDMWFFSEVVRDVFAKPPGEAGLVVRPSAFAGGGFADLALVSNETVPISIEPATLAMGRSIALQGVIASTGKGLVTLRAPYISLSGADSAAPAVDGLAGRLSLEASLIDVHGLPYLTGRGARIAGYADTVLQAQDVRLGSQNGEIVALDVDGRLTLRAGQVYPATAAQATVRAGQSIRLERVGDAAAPLSAGGTLRLEAPAIEQNGVLRAPFGQITLAAFERLSLGAGSITSVSGAPYTVPYGTLSNNEYWLDPTQQQLDGLNADQYQLAAPPEKRIVMESPEVLLAEGSEVDISGGGDLHAWEFVPGPGGSHDVLAQAGMYAVLPGYRGVSPVAGAQAGRQVWLAGGGGLPAGWYTLLPARYALLPGAYAVQSTGRTWQGAPRAGAGHGMGDGSWIMQGQARNPGAGTQDALGAAWRVMPGSVVRSYTEYNEAVANDFFSSDAFKLTQYRYTGQNVVTPRLPRDGGAVVFKAGEALLLDGSLRSQAAPGGLGGMVDIAGEKIAIVGAGRDSASLRADGYLVVDADSLTGFGAGSLLVGGTRRGDPLGMRVDVTASNIVVRNGADSVLAGPEIILAAGEEIAIAEGSRIAVKAGSGASQGDLIMTPQAAPIYTDPDGNLDDNWDGVIDEQDAEDDVMTSPGRDWGALIRVSNGAASSVVREGVDTSVGGRVSIGAAARLDGGAALLIDATRTTDLAASALLSAGDLSVSSGRIGFGGTGDGMVLNQAALAQLSRSRQLTLRSYSDFDFFESVDLTGAGLHVVVLDGARLSGHGRHDVHVRGATVTLQNTAGTAAGAAASGSGTLTLAADTLVLGQGNKAIAGFGAVVLEGAQEIVGEGSGALEAGNSALTLRTAVLTGRSGARQSVATGGALAVQSLQGRSIGGQDSLGSQLSLSGASVRFAGHASVLGGTLALTATDGDLIVADGARIDAGGSSRRIFDEIIYADAGRITLTSLAGSVQLQKGSLVNLAALTGGGNAGTLAVVSDGGSVALGGVVQAQAGQGGHAGAFTLDIDTLPDFAGLAARLDEAGFERSRSFRVRQGDVVVDGSSTTQNFILSADAGRVSVTGTVDARALYGGTIRITGGNGVAMRDGARLLAGATGELGSGRVTLDAVDGRLDAAGGLIDVSGGELGVVRLRAVRNAGNTDVAANPVGAQLRGARQAVLEGTRVYESDTVEAVKGQAVAEALDFAANANAIANRLGGGLAVMPGIEIQSDGDLAMASDWNLRGDIAGARAGTLTLRAAGNLTLAGSLSDGFDTAERSGTLQTGPSWGLQLVAGADLSSADALVLRPLATLGSGQGTITIGTADSGEGAADGAGKLVRTGTGDLAVRAGRDLVLAHVDSAIYTAGRRDTTTWSDFSTGAPDAAYGIEGGHLDIAAQGDVQARHSGQRFVEWLKRQGNINADGYFGPYTAGRNIFIPEDPYVLPRYEDPQQSSWWIDYGGFRQGLGALGGGNVTLDAGGDLDNLVVALATNMRMRGGRTASEAMRMETRNGGVMTVDAGGAIRGGQYYVARGTGRISAGETTVGHQVVVTKDIITREFDIAPVLALGDADLTLRTAGDLRLQAVIDPLLVRNGYDGRGPAPGPDDLSEFGADMSGYTDRSSLTLASIGGDVTLVNQADFVFRDVALQSYTTPVDNLVGSGGNLFPAQSRVVALNGSLEIQGPMYIVPGTRMDLRVLAQQDVRFASQATDDLENFVSYARAPMAEIIMAAATPAMMPSPYRPSGNGGAEASWFGPFDQVLRNTPQSGIGGNPMLQGLTNPAVLPLAGDFEPSRIYAGQGSITGLNLDAAEQTWVRAGTDIRSFNVKARNLRASDVTWLEAGNDIVALQPVQGSRVPNGIEAQGPGLLLLSAGRDVYAGDLAVQTLGNQNYDINNRPVPNTQILGLPAQGAHIAVMAGMNQAAAYDAFADAYLNPAKAAAMPDYLKQTVDGATLPIYLFDAVEQRPNGLQKTVRRGLVSYVESVTGETLEPLAAWARFEKLPALVQQQFLRQIFLQELRDAGRDQNVPGADDLPRNGGYNRGYAAIDALFPGDGWRGDVAANSLTLRTMAGGDIQVLTPGGGLQVAALGATIAPGAGLVTLASGHINIFAHDDVTVNRSRILSFVPEATGQGSDQIIWATQGDVDAGRGAKTVRVPSAPDIITDVDGNTMIVERSDMSGSGIGTVGDGDVDLIAPEGTINFGDAGVRVAGNFNIAALQVLNAANIEVQGESTGLPAMVSVNTAALTAASSSASAAAESAQEMASRQRNESRRNLPSIISVQILGFGSEPAGGGAAAPAAPSSRAEPLVYRTDSPVQVVGDGSLGPTQLARLTADERRRFGM